MNFRLFKTRLKCLFRNRVNIFWCYIFPIVLVNCYYFAFGNLYSTNDLKTISIAYVKDESGYGNSNTAYTQYDPLTDILEKAEIKEGIPLFKIRYTDTEEATGLLKEDEIEAYIVKKGNEPRLHVKRSGMNETVIKSILDSYKRANAAVQAIAETNPDALSRGLLDDVINYKSFTVEKKANAAPNIVLISYFSLLAFTCLFGSYWGLDEVVSIQANRSSIGARVNAAPVNKMKLLLTNMLAAFTAHIGTVVFMVLYMIKVLKIDFGDHTLHLILICFIGSVAGLFIGATVGVLVNKAYGVQSAILTWINLAGGLLSGMMFVDMKYIVAKKAPVLAYINPVNLISDSFYSLYYFDNFDRYYRNISCLGIITVILAVISCLGLRRKSYESI